MPRSAPNDSIISVSYSVLYTVWQTGVCFTLGSILVYERARFDGSDSISANSRSRRLAGAIAGAFLVAALGFLAWWAFGEVKSQIA
jgi:hypothetical protein